jgi:hypothetical protein
MEGFDGKKNQNRRMGVTVGVPVAAEFVAVSSATAEKRANFPATADKVKGDAAAVVC